MGKTLNICQHYQKRASKFSTIYWWLIVLITPADQNLAGKAGRERRLGF